MKPRPRTVPPVDHWPLVNEHPLVTATRARAGAIETALIHIALFAFLAINARALWAIAARELGPLVAGLLA